MDIALDDFSKSISYEMVDAALASGNYTGFRKASSRRNYDAKGKINGFTCTFGTRSSLRYTRFYDKDAESGGRIKSHRLETEVHDELAEKVLVDWLALEPETFEQLSPGYLAGVVIGSVSFIGRTEDKNVARMLLLPWWKEFIDKVGLEIRHSIQSVQTSYERKRNWFTRQVSVTLAMFKKVMGIRQFKQYLEKELTDAEERFNHTHEAFINVYCNQPEIDSSEGYVIGDKLFVNATPC
jgi:DNA relaxase NicK